MTNKKPVQEKPGDGLKRLRAAFLPPQIAATCTGGECNTPRACGAAKECCYARYHGRARGGR